MAEKGMIDIFNLKQIRKHFAKALKIKTSPHSIALGFAVGTLIGTLPIPFLDFFIGIFVALIFSGMSKISLFAAIVLWNPLTKIPIYAFSYRLGDAIFGSEPVVVYNVAILDAIFNYSRNFLVGNLIIAFGLSIAVYLPIYAIAWYLQKPLEKAVRNAANENKTKNIYRSKLLKHEKKGK